MSELTNLPKDVINRLINLGGVEKKLLCLKTRKLTLHVSISWAELEHRSFFKALDRVGADLNPFFIFAMGSLYICEECNRVRADGGVLSDYWNKNHSVTLI